MRRLPPLALFLLLLAPGALAQQPLSVAPDETVGTLDTRHLSAAFRFTVTNGATEPDYVTIPRGDIRWADDRSAALGFPSPEFGLALGPGESGRMLVRVDLAEPRVGERTLLVPFRSERTGVTETAQVRVVVSPAPPADATLVVRVVDAQGAPVPGARVEVTDLSTPMQDAEARGDPGGAWTAQVRPGRHAARADAPGFQGATAFLDLAAGARREATLTLRPVQHEVDEASLRWTNVGDSAWLLAGSEDLSRLATAPMTHQQPTPGAFVGVEDAEVAWRAPFDALRPPHDKGSPFQALDTAVAVSADGAFAAGADWNGRVHVVDFATGDVLWTADEAERANPLYPPGSPYRTGFFNGGAVAFSPDGARLAAGGTNGHLALFDARTGERLWARDFGGEVRALRFSHDGATLFAGAGDWRFRALDAATGATRWEGENEFWPFFFVALDADGARVATGGKDAVLRVWDAETGEELRAFDVFPAFVTGAGFAHDGGVVMSDWGYGVRAFDADGDPAWFRRLKTANAAVSEDGRFTAVAWASEGGAAGGLELLDASGTTVWRGDVDLGAACTSTVSPFPPRQLKSVHVHQPEPLRLRVAAACIGGGVLVADVALRERDPGAPPPADPVEGTTPTGNPGAPPAGGAPPTGGASPSPPPREDDADTPAPGLALVAAALLAAAWMRRR